MECIRIFKKEAIKQFTGRKEMALSTGVERFLRYVSINTAADPLCRKTPSNPQQFVLAQMLRSELQQVGLKRIELTPEALLVAEIEPSVGCENLPAIGFLAHLDSPRYSQLGPINVGIVQQYDGGDILLNERDRVVLTPEKFPNLLHYVADDLIVSDGPRCFGAQAKAGIAAVMEMVEHFCRFRADPHARIMVAFVPDLLLGRGVCRLRKKLFPVSYAYSIAGGPLGELGFNSFHAAVASVDFLGVDRDPGEAFGTLNSALKMAERFLDLLPQSESAENTQDYEGFFHPVFVQTTTARAHLELLIREHDADLFEKRKACVRRWTAGFGPCARLSLVEQYHNMSVCLAAHPLVMDKAREACTDCAVHFYEPAVRRPAAGAWLCSSDLPCADIFTGSENPCGPYEFLPVSAFEKAVSVVKRLAQLSAQDSFSL